MNVSEINNQPSFGIRYINKEMWNKGFLKTFSKSDLVKSIDAKYSKASASYRKILETDIFSGKPNYHLSFQINLGRKRSWKFVNDSKSPSEGDKILKETLDKLSINEIEEKSQKRNKFHRAFISEVKPRKTSLLTYIRQLLSIIY